MVKPVVGCPCPTLYPPNNMCLIVFAWQIVDGFPLICTANRDEFYQRPSAAVAWWTDHPTIFAPRDLKAGGTWSGVKKLKKQGYKFAALTNVRDGSPPLSNAPSRGKLVTDYLLSNADVQTTVQALRKDTQHYNGFNLLIGEISATTQELAWFSNRHTDDPLNGQLLKPGIYGLSNGTLNSPWPKVCKTKAELASLLCQNAPREAYFEMLANTQLAPDHRLPNTGVSLELERLLSAVCVESEQYGTRSSTLLEIPAHGAFQYEERVLR